MRIERDHRAVAEAFAHDQVHSADHAVGAHQGQGHRVALDGKTPGLEQRCRAQGMRRAVARRIVGWHFHELGQKLDGRGLGAIQKIANGLSIGLHLASSPASGRA